MASSHIGLLAKIWTFLPAGLRNNRGIRALAHRLKSFLITPQPGQASHVAVEHTPVTNEAPSAPVSDQAVFIPGVPVISSLAELDHMLAKLDQAALISDDELRRGFTQFQMRFPLALPDDPDSDLYRQKQFELYEHLSGKAYRPANEVSQFDVENALARPFPFSSRSAQTVGHHLISIGHLIRTMNLPAGARILEFGPGWGNTTLWLSQMGYQVTAIDIEANFIELIQRRAQGNGVNIDARVGDFSEIANYHKEYDAVLFFECFHHCSDHQALIAKLDQVLTNDGIAVFAAEPILEAFPIPWGLRLDGESLWAIRKFGWLELGFKESYFRALLLKHGWQAEKFHCPETPWGEIFVARRLPRTHE